MEQSFDTQKGPEGPFTLVYFLYMIYMPYSIAMLLTTIQQASPNDLSRSKCSLFH